MSTYLKVADLRANILICSLAEEVVERYLTPEVAGVSFYGRGQALHIITGGGDTVRRGERGHSVGIFIFLESHLHRLSETLSGTDWSLL